MEVGDVDLADLLAFKTGRTGRGDAEGWALNLASMAEMGRVGNIELLQKRESEWHKLEELTPASDEPLLPPMVTIQLLGGRKEKLRPGDLLGALTGECGFVGSQIGKINVTDFHTYVAVDRDIAAKVVAQLNRVPVKGKKTKARLLKDVQRQERD